MFKGTGERFAVKDAILVVEPEGVAAEMVCSCCGGGDFSWVWLKTAAEALAKLERSRFSLLITELALSDSSGMDLVRRARTLDPDLAVIVTASAMDTPGVTVPEACQFLPKPLRPDLLAFHMGKALERRGMLIENRRQQALLEERVVEATADLMRANAELRKTRDYLENLLDTSLDTVITTDPGHTINYANRGAGETLGYLWFSLVGRQVSDIIEGGVTELGEIAALLANGPIRNREMRLVAANQRRIPVITSISRLADPEGRVLSTLFICKDITQQKELEEELKKLSIMDSLTGLHNQRHFFERLDMEMERALRQNYPISLLLFDVDNFKSYNDNHGHLDGDKVLVAAGRVVRECIRDHVDSGYRYGGDEFVVILPETDEIQARLVAERIRSVFEALRFDNCTLSVGLMTCHGTASSREFVRLADLMMYDAKRSGGNRVYVHDPGTGEMKLERSET